MLAKTPITDTYLPADVLGITEAELEALKWVREELASGRIEHDPTEGLARVNEGRGFNMETPETKGCGTVACIGGWMALSLGKEATGFVGRPVYGKLFWPRQTNCRWNDLTPAQAVRAIDAWATGHQSDCWTLALSTD